MEPTLYSLVIYTYYLTPNSLVPNNMIIKGIPVGGFIFETIDSLKVYTSLIISTICSISN